MGRPDISLDRPRKWMRPLQEGVLPAYDEALRVIRADARRVRKEAAEQRAKVRAAHEKLVAETEAGGKLVEGEARKTLEGELEGMRERLEILEVQSEVNLPEVRWSVANAMSDLSIPSHRHLLRQRWRSDGALDLLMERIHQMHVVPDVLPVLHPSIDLHVAARLMPVHFDSLMKRNRAQRRVNTFKEVEPGRYLTPKQTRVQPKLYANVFHTDVRLYTMLLVDPDVPDEERQTYTTFLHWLKPNIPLSATHTGRIPFLNTHTRYVPPHPQRGTPYHRYVMLLLPQPPIEGYRYTRNTEALLTEQQAQLSQSIVPEEARPGFDVRAFAREWGLNGALGGGVHMWREVWDKYVGAVYRYELHTPQPMYGRPPRPDPQRETHEAPTRRKYRIGA
ncbi:phosphatidylethanolamine-binding protein [Mycena maculata]|uniref:Phosphatidylethanolamine-binding protein n=1 Tax=Mycena maculata TaxID=230809 RepID=A0AAD7MNT7_9AGAR|nr:phosphatidylethanolamine-binding protein [Mycena maculata]